MANVELVRAIFKKVDTDGDGEVTVNELATVFAKYDTDGDGKVKKEEFVTSFVEKYPGVPKERAEKVFDKMDKAGKGEVTLVELEAVFKAMDTDGDGILKEEEFVTKWCEMMA